MPSERSIRRCRKWYAKLLRLYPQAYRDRFGESMEQTFHDLCRERAKEHGTLFTFALWIFFETAAAIFRQNAKDIMRNVMNRDSKQSLKTVKYFAITVGALMLAGIGALMIISRGKGEDITGIVAPALLITIISGAVAAVSAVLQKRAQNP